MKPTIQKRTSELVKQFEGKLPKDRYDSIVDFIEHAEWGIGLEVLCEGLFESAISVSPDQLSTIQSLAMEMGLPFTTWDFLAKPSPLSIVKGTPLSSVEFVQDYVQLRFDGPCLTAHTPPSVVKNYCRLRWNEPGYRDALCGAIGQTVSAVVVDAERIGIEFGPEMYVEISLKPAGAVGPEAAVFSYTDGQTAVF